MRHKKIPCIVNLIDFPFRYPLMLGLVDALWFLLKILSEIFWQIGSGTWIWTWSETWSFGTVDLVHHFDRVFDLAFVRLEVHDENESVVVLDFLHGRLRSQRKLDYAVTVNLLDVLLVLELVHGLTCVLRVAAH